MLGFIRKLQAPLSRLRRSRAPAQPPANPPSATQPSSRPGAAVIIGSQKPTAPATSSATPKPAGKQPAALPSTPAEFQRAARAERPLLRFMGFRHSGILSRSVMKRRWSHQQAFFGGLPLKQLLIIGGGAALAIIAITAGVYFGSAASYDPNVAGGDGPSVRLQRNPTLDAAVAFIMACAFIIPSSTLFRLRLQWAEIYAEVNIYEAADKRDPWRTTGMIETVAPRLAFIDPQTDYFSGPTRFAGPKRGVVNLQLPPGIKIMDAIREYKDIYALSPGESRYTEVAARQIYDYIADTAEEGEMKRDQERKSMSKVIGEHWPWVCIVIGMVIILFQVTG